MSEQHHPPSGRLRQIHPIWWAGTLCFLLSCAGMQLNTGAALMFDGYARGPGSFCALNPEGCPPIGNSYSGEPEEDADIASNKGVCLDACEAGGEVLANFCRRLKSPRRQALCWAATTGSRVACIGMCHALYK